MSALHVLFKVGGSDYALPADIVVQMESFAGATRVPGSASHVAGLVQIRGKVVPVVDLRVRFGLPPLEPTLDSRVIVVDHGGRHVAFLADSAREVVKLEPDALKPPPEAVVTQAHGFVDRVAQVGKRLVLRLDHEKVMGNDGLPKGHGDGEETT